MRCCGSPLASAFEWNESSDAHGFRAQPGVQFELDPLEVGNQVVHIALNHAVAGHGGIQASAGRVDSLPNGLGEARLSERGMATPPGVGVSARPREVVPGDVGRDPHAVWTAAPLRAMAAGAGQQVTGSGRTGQADLGADPRA